jgi:hypothetical protein
LIAVVSFLLDVISQLWPKAKFIGVVSLNKYYDPPAILLRNGFVEVSFLVLGAVIAVCLALAFWRMHTRDLP